ncbi:DDE-type integrase/transposase/recombinase [Deinococcus aestuarii]|uniref:DDE-type integrase/transposase/recombinase n=1 Tax=Deinococcus aestuarii TaxID=2774531 RepID=UPI001C0D876D|nr:DDE-type integrase/transposase/recombinase [Deinococcus aestuarii]
MAGTPAATRLSIGMRVEHRGVAWQVTHLDGVEVRLQHVSGQTETMAFHQFVDLPLVRRLVEARKENAPRAPEHPLDIVFTSLDQKLQDEALRRLAHLREAVTGYRSGFPDQAEPHEPRPEYDPATTTQTQRFEAKAKELTSAGVKVTPRTLRFQRDEYGRRGLMALVDARKLRGTLPFGRNPTPVVEAARKVVGKAGDASTVTKKKHIEDVRDEVKALLAEGNLLFQGELPSYSSLARLLDALSRNQYTYKSAKLRRSIAGRPQRMYQMLTPTRVGEYVVIDASTYDVRGFDSITGRRIRHRLVVAIDVYSRCILAARFFENDPKGIDITFLLYDLIAPKPAPPEWPETALLPYIGLPEELIVVIHDLPEGTRLKAIPFAQPDNLVIDNGRIFISKVFASACERLGISLIIARPYTGNDKAHVERFFETARDGFCVYLPGYTGNNALNKGRNPEEEAYYFRHELENEFHLWLARVYHVRAHSELQAHDVPGAHATPLETFRAGISASGYLYVPTDPNLYQGLLETQWRKIHAYGVDYYGILYDAPELVALRNQDCPYSVKGGRWPFQVDKRDLRYLHFQHPDKGWIRLTRRDARHADAPFSNVHLEVARRTLIRTGGNPHKREEMSQALDELLSEGRASVAENAEQRRQEVRALHAREQAYEDQLRLDASDAATRGMEVLTPTPRLPERPLAVQVDEEGFGTVDDLEPNVANVFARGTTSYWDQEE